MLAHRKVHFRDIARKAIDAANDAWIHFNTSSVFKTNIVRRIVQNASDDVCYMSTDDVLGQEVLR